MSASELISKKTKIGTMHCPICGNICPVNRSESGRLSMVCKWQESGCGCQLLTIAKDAAVLLSAMVANVEEPKPEQEERATEEKGKADQRKTEPKAGDPELMRGPSPAEAWAGLV